MAHAYLFTIERDGAGLARTNLAYVKGTTQLTVVSQNKTEVYPLVGARSSTTLPIGSPKSGKADLRLQVGDDEIDLARCKGAVGVIVSSGYHTTLYWIIDGQCAKLSEPTTFAVAIAEIEGRYCQECKLPPLI